MSLAGRTALVTGASRGIGAEIARSLGASGARVALLARSLSALEQLAGEIGAGAFAVEADLSVAGKLARAADSVREHFGGPPDILVNNAGVFEIVQIHEMKLETFALMVDTNVTGPFGLLREFLPEMRERGSGHIVTVGSVADRAIFAGNAGYSATKFAMRAIHEVLREETRGSGVRATLVSPSSVDTDIWEPIRFPGSSERPDRSSMLPPGAVASAVHYALTQPDPVNVDELRLSRS